MLGGSCCVVVRQAGGLRVFDEVVDGEDGILYLALIDRERF